jgi:hypothetical protein
LLGAAGSLFCSPISALSKDLGLIWMAKRLLTICSAAFVGAVLVIISAPANSGQYTTIGIGDLSCGKLLEAMHKETKQDFADYYAMGSWIAGFISGANDMGNLNVGQTTDNDGRDAWIANYCQAHPLSLIVDAAEALYVELKRSNR